MEAPGSRRPSMKEQKQEMGNASEQQLKDAGLLLPGQTGHDFYHRAWSPKAKAAKRTKRQQARRSKRGNRRK